MIFNRLVLHNFGVYKGRQEIHLSPPSPGRPVVLIGALNGGGKTTLLDGIQLALYGKLAQCSNRGTNSYEEFLRQSIHRDVDPKDGAAVELEFTARSAGVEDTYRIRRSWSVPSSSARERVVVHRNDVVDELLTESWHEYAEIFLPSGIAPLFLFDGEKIEALADPEQSSEMLKAAIHSLLGVDIVDQLAADLAVVQKRRVKKASESDLTSEIDTLEQELLRLKASRDESVQSRAAMQNQQDRALKELRNSEQRYRREGGEVFEKRSALEAEFAAIERELHTVDEDLRDVAAHELPLCLVQALISEVAEQDKQERASTNARMLCDVLEERDAALLELVKSVRPPKEVSKQLTAFLEEDRSKRQEAAQNEQYLDLAQESSITISALLDGGFDTAKAQTRTLLDRENDLRSRVTELNRKLESVPAAQAIEHLSKEVDNARLLVLDCEKQMTHIETVLEDNERASARAEEARTRALRRNVDAEFAREDDQRIVRHAQKVRDTLDTFRTDLLRRNTERLATFVFESYGQLLRKKSLVRSVHIDPESFLVSLISADGSDVRPERLSAGERQLLATAILWGLARASGKVLPMVIDTPLGRLDSEHRSRLVEKYFPHASHQVVLLSTDEEIDERYYKKLKSRLGRTYRLEFDERERATTVREGYFPEALSQ